MHKWRDERWDAFCLVTPNWQCQLPGHDYDRPDPHGFMVKDHSSLPSTAFARSSMRPSARMSRSCQSKSRKTTSDLTSDGACTADRWFWRRASMPSRARHGPPRNPGRASSRSTPSTTAMHRPYHQAKSSSWAQASPARKSPRTCISRAARFISSPATRRAARASIAAETLRPGYGTSAIQEHGRLRWHGSQAP